MSAFQLPKKVVPGSPILARDQNLVIEAMKTVGDAMSLSGKMGAMPRTRPKGGASARLPFEVSATPTATGVNVHVNAGVWFGRGGDGHLTYDFATDEAPKRRQDYGGDGVLYSETTKDSWLVPEMQNDVDVAESTSEVCVFLFAETSKSGFVESYPWVFTSVLGVGISILSHNAAANHWRAFSVLARIKIFRGENGAVIVDRVDNFLSQNFYFRSPAINKLLHASWAEGMRDTLYVSGGIATVRPHRIMGRTYSNSFGIFHNACSQQVDVLSFGERDEQRTEFSGHLIPPVPATDFAESQGLLSGLGQDILAQSDPLTFLPNRAYQRQTLPWVQNIPEKYIFISEEEKNEGVFITLVGRSTGNAVQCENHINDASRPFLEWTFEKRSPRLFNGVWDSATEFLNNSKTNAGRLIDEINCGDLSGHMLIDVPQGVMISETFGIEAAGRKAMTEKVFIVRNGNVIKPWRGFDDFEVEILIAYIRRRKVSDLPGNNRVDPTITQIQHGGITVIPTLLLNVNADVGAGCELISTEHFVVQKKDGTVVDEDSDETEFLPFGDAAKTKWEYDSEKTRSAVPRNVKSMPLSAENFDLADSL